MDEYIYFKGHDFLPLSQIQPQYRDIYRRLAIAQCRGEDPFAFQEQKKPEIGWNEPAAEDRRALEQLIKDVKVLGIYNLDLSKRTLPILVGLLGNEYVVVEEEYRGIAHHLLQIGNITSPIELQRLRQKVARALDDILDDILLVLNIDLPSGWAPPSSIKSQRDSIIEEITKGVRDEVMLHIRPISDGGYHLRYKDHSFPFNLAVSDDYFGRAGHVALMFPQEEKDYKIIPQFQLGEQKQKPLTVEDVGKDEIWEMLFKVWNSSVNERTKKRILKKQISNQNEHLDIDILTAIKGYVPK